MKYRSALALLALAFATVALPAHAATSSKNITVYKSQSCGCCGNWVAYLQKHGYKVNVRDVDSLDSINKSLHVSKAMAGCHTATIGGYVVVGHVPVQDIERMLKTHPAIAGISVPGMQAGPGMDMGPGAHKHYSVVSFDDQGRQVGVFAHHEPK